MWVSRYETVGGAGGVRGIRGLLIRFFFLCVCARVRACAWGRAGSKTVYTSTWSRTAASEFVCPRARSWGDWDPGASYWVDCLSPATAAIHILYLYINI